MYKSQEKYQIIFCPKGFFSECTKKTTYFCQQPSKNSNKCNVTIVLVQIVTNFISKETNIKSEEISNNAVCAK